MPTDRHGVTHVGTIGLFDDDDEYQVAMDNAERHERKHLESKIRRQERRDKRQQRKEDRAADQEISGKSKLLWPFSRLGRFFGGGKKPRLDATSTIDDGDEPTSGIQKTTEYVIVRKPSTPEVVYTAQDVDTTIDSPWLRECGMVRVMSDDAGGCHIVPKSSIQKSE